MRIVAPRAGEGRHPNAGMKSETTMVRVRFAPSPTGFLHIGSARTAIFNWLYARHAGGKACQAGAAAFFGVEPGRAIAYEDLIHGRISVESETIKDQVMIKSDGSPTYNFSCVVDDTHLGITHILRGDDHISNTPKQIIFYEAFRLEPPRFGR